MTTDSASPTGHVHANTRTAAAAPPTRAEARADLKGFPFMKRTRDTRSERLVPGRNRMQSFACFHDSSSQSLAALSDQTALSLDYASLLYTLSSHIEQFIIAIS